MFSSIDKLCPGDLVRVKTYTRKDLFQRLSANILQDVTGIFLGCVPDALTCSKDAELMLLNTSGDEITCWFCDEDGDKIELLSRWDDG